MEIFEWVAVGILVVLAVLAALFARRAWVARAGGTIKLTIRLSTMVSGRGWSPGFARFDGDDLRWYRMFSLAIRPRRVLSRNGLVVQSRREPTGPEKFALPDDWVILRCLAQNSPVEIAMARSTVTGFLSWIEAAPPGAVSRLATR
ncbi:DUF2550 domain-containing protein [Rhizomonospora bruguierae]|uniref:DUF2550 domain-containing protein n=1 Tax=Rhizomonospora bruguierae TaxID=1581705 RepID=UPI001BD17870|nr:DUF2550 domain-containing protein [Micromonospora sp. NBRC 107566]